MKKVYLFLMTVIIPQLLAAQASDDFLRSTGKIYSVVVVLVIMFLGLVFYVWRLDKKVKQMEDERTD
jgi:predicted membrane channel-forming protein YqfA (hemolysin III family)